MEKAFQGMKETKNDHGSLYIARGFDEVKPDVNSLVLVMGNSVSGYDVSEVGGGGDRALAPWVSLHSTLSRWWLAWRYWRARVSLQGGADWFSLACRQVAPLAAPHGPAILACS